MYTAGEIDRDLGVAELIVDEFERFNELQRQYAPSGEYPEEGLFQENSVSLAVHGGLRRLGGSAVLGGLIIPEGHRLVVPTSPAMERSFPVYYTEIPHGPSQLWTKPQVVAYRKIKKTQDAEHPWRLPGECDYDETVGIGVGVVAMKGAWLTAEKIGGYDISLNLQRTGDHSRVHVSKTVYSHPKQRLTLQETEVHYNVQEEAQKDIVQLFREAAWDSVSEPA